MTPWTAACRASLSITNSQILFKLMPIMLVMPSNHPIFCSSFLLLPILLIFQTHLLQQVTGPIKTNSFHKVIFFSCLHLAPCKMTLFFSIIITFHTCLPPWSLSLTFLHVEWNPKPNYIQNTDLFAYPSKEVNWLGKHHSTIPACPTLIIRPWVSNRLSVLPNNSTVFS